MHAWFVGSFINISVEKADQNEGLGVHGQSGQGHFSDPSLGLQI